MTRTVYAKDGSILYRDHTTQRTQESRRRNPATSQLVALRERDQRLPTPEPDVTAVLTKLFERMGMSAQSAAIAAKGRER